MYSHALSEALLHDGNKGAVFGEVDVRKREVGGDRTPRKRTGVVSLEVGHLLRLVAVLEVGICLIGFPLTGRSQERVGPYGRAISLLLGPVALVVVRCWGADSGARLIRLTFQAGVP